MKEDYLFNKTGSDAEIEGLENALKEFRWQESAPPELPAKVVPFEKKTRRGFFRLSLGFAAFAAILIVFSVVWFQTSSGNVEPVNDFAKTVTPPINAETSNNSDADAKTPSPQKSTAVVPTAVVSASRARAFDRAEISDSEAGRIRDGSRDDRGTLALTPRNVVKSEKSISVITPQNDENAKNIEASKPAVKLTKEEKFAYDQLMLALSITSSKLKLVQDKVDGIEEKTAVLENER